MRITKSQLNLTLQVCCYSIAIFLLSRLCNVSFIHNNNLLATLYANCSRIVFLVVLIIYLLRKTKVSKMLIALIFLFSCSYFTSLSNGGNIEKLLSMYYPIIGMVCFVEIIKKDWKLLKIFIYAFSAMCYIFVVINLLDILLFQDVSGEYSTIRFFLGIRNQLALFFAFGMPFICLYNQETKSNFSKFVECTYVISIVLTAILSKSATTTLAVFFLVVAYKTHLLDVLIKKVGAIKLFIAYLLGMIAIVGFKAQTLFAFIVEDVLRRNLTFTHRTVIWDSTIQKILDRPWLGYGIKENNNVYFQEVWNYGQLELKGLSAHNTFLQFLYENGLIFMFALMVFIVFVLKNKYGKTFNLFFCSFMAVLIVAMSEAIGLYAISILLYFCYISNYFDNAINHR